VIIQLQIRNGLLNYFTTNVRYIKISRGLKYPSTGVYVDIQKNTIDGKVRNLILDTLRSARAEIILVIFPFQTKKNATLNQGKNALIELLLEVTQNDNVKVRILVASDGSTDNSVEKLKVRRNIDIKFIEPLPEGVLSFELGGNAESLLFIVDKQSALALASKENGLSNFGSSSSSAGSSDEIEPLYSVCTSRADVLSHVTAFESLWMQSGIHEKINSHRKKQDEFLDVAAHELRTPIQPILGLTEILRSKINDIQQQELLDVIIRNAKKLQQLSDDILEVTRIESKKLILNKERFNLNDIIYDIVQDYKNNLAKDFNRKLLFDDTNNIFFVEADKSRISQVISNLVNNSLKFTPQGTITISLRKTKIQSSKSTDSINNDKNNNNDTTQEAVEVRVTDNGAGLDPEILPRLFTKFESKSYKGTGLGLFISKSIIVAHGGKIWAENNNKNDKGKMGCTFYFILPTIQGQEKVSDRKKRVLLVDGDLKFTSKLEPILGNKHDVNIFNDPVLAMNNFISGFYDVVILGVELRNMSGFDLCQQIRLKDKKAKIYFLTEGGKTHYKALRELYGISDTEQFLDRDELETYNLGH
jgi:two-component system sensor histidine kinase VicK